MAHSETENTGQSQSGETGGNKHEVDVDLAIVGGGFSGICTAWHVLTCEKLPENFRCLIIEPGERLGAGLAYRTDCPLHLLNVRARGMSITASDTRSFARWLAEAAPEYSPDDFVPRGLYRRYIVESLEQARQLRPPEALTVLRDEVLTVVPLANAGGYRMRLKSDGVIRAGSVVLAIGNLPPRSSLGNGLLRAPWCGPADYSRFRSLAIVGAGLTALDIILEAEASGFSGRYWVISPHGRFPCCHQEPFLPVPDDVRQWAAKLASTEPTLCQAVRAFQLKRHSGVHWEHLVDALRGFAPAIWKGFGSADRRRFLRRLRGLWNIHLHRTCERSIRIVKELMASGRLEQVNARVTAVEKRSDAGVRLVLQSDAAAMLDVDAAVNATGLFSNIHKTDSALVVQLLEDGVAQPDEFCLGLRANGSGRLLSADGSIWPGLFAIGTVRRGQELECTAVPEIRRQVADVVAEIARMMEDDSGSDYGTNDSR